MNCGLTIRDLEEITAALNGYPEIEEAVLFGSRAKGNYKTGSDVDLAVKGRDISHACVSELSYVLNEESSLPYYFDIVHYENISEKALTEHIDRVGQLIYKNQRSE